MEEIGLGLHGAAWHETNKSHLEKGSQPLEPCGRQCDRPWCMESITAAFNLQSLELLPGQADQCKAPFSAAPIFRAASGLPNTWTLPLPGHCKPLLPLQEFVLCVCLPLTEVDFLGFWGDGFLPHLGPTLREWMNCYLVM